MKVIAVSLGGSLIIPDKINFNFLEKFKKELRKHYKEVRFVVVTGGGSIARKYISALREEGKSEIEISYAGIRATRMNALFLMQFFGKEANDELPKNMEQVRDNLHKNKIVICGALRYADDETSDGTAAKLAHFLNCEFINMTNVRGLYTSDPKKDKNAKFIPKISWDKFEKMAKAIKFSAGQHFILDQTAAELIKKHKIKTYIVNDNLANLGGIIKNKRFSGTLIGG